VFRPAVCDLLFPCNHSPYPLSGLSCSLASSQEHPDIPEIFVFLFRSCANHAAFFFDGLLFSTPQGVAAPIVVCSSPAPVAPPFFLLLRRRQASQLPRTFRPPSLLICSCRRLLFLTAFESHSSPFPVCYPLTRTSRGSLPFVTNAASVKQTAKISFTKFSLRHTKITHPPSAVLLPPDDVIRVAVTRTTICAPGTTRCPTISFVTRESSFYLQRASVSGFPPSTVSSQIVVLTCRPVGFHLHNGFLSYGARFCPITFPTIDQE